MHAHIRFYYTTLNLELMQIPKKVEASDSTDTANQDYVYHKHYVN